MWELRISVIEVEEEEEGAEIEEGKREGISLILS